MFKSKLIIVIKTEANSICQKYNFLLFLQMKSRKDKSNADNFVFDDDTSDSDEENLEVFKSKVSGLHAQSSGPDDVDDDVEDEEESDEESDEDSSDVSSDDEAVPPSFPPQISEEKKSILSKIQNQLAGIESDEDQEDEEEEEEDDKFEENESEGDDQELESRSESSDDGDQSDNESAAAVKPRKRPQENQSNLSGDKKIKLDDQPESEEAKKLRFRSKLSKMSVEEIQRLKNKLGLKLFNQKMSGTGGEKQKADFKRENKNRPREMSSKKQVGRFREVVSVSTEVKAPKRDPRFDPMCGEFNDKLFKDNYGFVNEYKVSDLKFLKKQLQEEEDPERKKQIQYLIQRTENQLRQLEQDKVKETEKKAEIEERKSQLKAGIKPVYISKSKQKEKDLVKKYEKLKQTGGLDSYIKKKTKKNVAKDRKRFENL